MQRETKLVVYITILLLVAGTLVHLERRATPNKASSGELVKYDGTNVNVLRDETRSVTCYVYRNVSISCVRDHGK